MNETYPCFITIEIKEQIKKLDVFKCGPDKDFFRFASVGETIKKEKGRLYLIIIKERNKINKEFAYPYCIE